jgi:hypothetical protein
MGGQCVCNSQHRNSRNITSDLAPTTPIPAPATHLHWVEIQRICDCGQTAALRIGNSLNCFECCIPSASPPQRHQRFLRLRFLHPEMNPQGPPAIVAPAVSPSPVSTVQRAQQDRMNGLLTNAYVLLDIFGLQTLWIPKG